MSIKFIITQGAELLYCGIDILLLHYFSSIFLKKKSIGKISEVVIFIIASIGIYLMNLTSIYSLEATVISFIIICSYVLLVFEGKILKRLLSVGFFYILLGIITLLLTALSPLVLQTSLIDINQNLILRGIVVLSIKAMMFLLGYIIKRYYKEVTTKLLDMKRIIFFFLIAFIFLLLFFEFVYLSEILSMTNLILVVAISFSISMMLVIFLTMKYIKANEMSLMYSLQLEESKLKNKEYVRIANEQVEIMKIKHDFKNHLIILRNFAKQGNIEDISAYVGKLIDQPQIKTLAQTRNVFINAIINQKISENPNINFSLKHDGGEYQITPDKLAIILGNALDNAIEAVSKSANEAHINIVISESKSLIKMYIANPLYETPIIKGNRLISQKKSKHSGFGFNNIKDAVNSINGRVEYRIEENLFELIILIYKSLII